MFMINHDGTQFGVQFGYLLKLGYQYNVFTQKPFTCSKSTIETLEKAAKYVQS